MTNPTRIVSWNAKVNRPAGDVMNGIASIIENLTPDAIAFQEFKGYVSPFRDRFGDHWRLYAANDYAESNDNPVAVRKDDYANKERGQGWDTFRTNKQWTGPKGGTHDGRTWTWVKVGDLFVVSFHRCTDGNGSNAAAFAEEHDRVVKFIGNHSPIVVVGDHNCGPKVDYPNASKLIAKHSGGKVNHDGGIDYAIVHGVGGNVAVKNKHGSDHPAIVWKRS